MPVPGRRDDPVSFTPAYCPRVGAAASATLDLWCQLEGLAKTDCPPRPFRGMGKVGSHPARVIAPAHYLTELKTVFRPPKQTENSIRPAKEYTHDWLFLVVRSPFLRIQPGPAHPGCIV